MELRQRLISVTSIQTEVCRDLISKPKIKHQHWRGFSQTSLLFVDFYKVSFNCQQDILFLVCFYSFLSLIGFLQNNLRMNYVCHRLSYQIVIEISYLELCQVGIKQSIYYIMYSICIKYDVMYKIDQLAKKFQY